MVYQKHNIVRQGRGKRAISIEGEFFGKNRLPGLLLAQVAKSEIIVLPHELSVLFYGAFKMSQLSRQTTVNAKW